MTNNQALSFSFNLGEVYHDEGDYVNAIANYNKAIKLHPTDVRFYVRRAEAFLSLTDFHVSISIFTELSDTAYVKDN